jgi:hypothetical protein
MKYDKPKAIRLNDVFPSSAECCAGTNPALTGNCTAGGGFTKGAACNSGCGAENHCHNGSDAGLIGKSNQYCSSGASANAGTCNVGAAILDNVTYGCMAGTSAGGCLSGNSATWTGGGACQLGTGAKS